MLSCFYMDPEEATKVETPEVETVEEAPPADESAAEEPANPDSTVV